METASALSQCLGNLTLSVTFTVSGGVQPLYSSESKSTGGAGCYFNYNDIFPPLIQDFCLLTCLWSRQCVDQFTESFVGSKPVTTCDYHLVTEGAFITTGLSDQGTQQMCRCADGRPAYQLLKHSHSSAFLGRRPSSAGQCFLFLRAWGKDTSTVERLSILL